MANEARICKHFQNGSCERRMQGGILYKYKMSVRHKRGCSYFERSGHCKFGDFCEYKHNKPIYITKIEVLEKEISDYKEDYELFKNFFRTEILNKQIEIQKEISCETEHIKKLNEEISNLKITNSEMKSKLDRVEKWEWFKQPH